MEKQLLFGVMLRSKDEVAMDATFFPDFYLDIEVEDIVEDLNRSQYSVSLYVNDKKVEKSKKSKPRLSAVKWEWKTSKPM